MINAVVPGPGAGDCPPAGFSSTGPTQASGFDFSELLAALAGDNAQSAPTDDTGSDLQAASAASPERPDSSVDNVDDAEAVKRARNRAQRSDSLDPSSMLDPSAFMAALASPPTIQPAAVPPPCGDNAQGQDASAPVNGGASHNAGTPAPSDFVRTIAPPAAPGTDSVRPSGGIQLAPQAQIIPNVPVAQPEADPPRTSQARADIAQIPDVLSNGVPPAAARAAEAQRPASIALPEYLAAPSSVVDTVGASSFDVQAPDAQRQAPPSVPPLAASALRNFVRDTTGATPKPALSAGATNLVRTLNASAPFVPRDNMPLSSASPADVENAAGPDDTARTLADAVATGAIQAGPALPVPSITKGPGVAPPRPDDADSPARFTGTAGPAAMFARALARVGPPEGTAANLVPRRPWTPVTNALVLPAEGATEPSIETASLPEVAPMSSMNGSIDDASLERQVVQAIRMQWQAGVGEATIRLQPAHLGSMTVSLRVEGGAVSADMRVETAGAESWISAHEVDLRSGLERQGLTLDRMVVSQDGSPDRRQERNDRRQPRDRSRRQAANPDAFEVVV